MVPSFTSGGSMAGAAALGAMATDGAASVAVLARSAVGAPSALSVGHLGLHLSSAAAAAVSTAASAACASSGAAVATATATATTVAASQDAAYASPNGPSAHANGPSALAVPGAQQHTGSFALAPLSHGGGHHLAPLLHGGVNHLAQQPLPSPTGSAISNMSGLSAAQSQASRRPTVDVSRACVCVCMDVHGSACAHGCEWMRMRACMDVHGCACVRACVCACMDGPQNC
eukprot:354858-Chlamydomonas_euryale.AAC.5